MIETFKRMEKKYILNKSQYKELFNRMKDHLEKDKYYKSNISNIYFDTDDFYLINKSIDKSIYKEKVRLRSYFVPKGDDKVFLELKKKYKGISNKRRICLTLDEFNNYFYKGIEPNCNKQILEELNYSIKSNSLKPKVLLAYDRLSYYDKENKDFRITFDKNLRYRTTDLELNHGSSGNKYFEDDECIMELKTLDSFPLWITNILSELKIYPVSFSKYGNIYKNYIF